MNAYEIAWDETETWIALGGGGLVRVHACEKDGAPGEERCRMGLHDAPIVLVAWAGAHVVSVDYEGLWVLSDGQNGEVVRSGSVEGEYVAASLSPDGTTLFLFTYKGDSIGARIRLSDGLSEEHVLPDEVSVTSRVFALNADRALYHFVSDDQGATTQGFAELDFRTGASSLRTFSRGPTSTFQSEDLLLAIDPAAGLGVRANYGPPEVDDEGRVPIHVEVFNLATLVSKHRVRIAGLSQEAVTGPSEAILTAAPGSAEHAEALDWFLKVLCSAKFADDSIWITLQGGAVTKVRVTGERAALVFHGGGADTGPPSLNDVFARSLRNNFTLAVSTSGRFVGFGNPNDFFDATALEGDRVQLPRRERDVIEAPGFVGFAGTLLVVADRGDGLHLVTPTGSITRVQLPQYYGEVRGAALAGPWLVLAVAGGSALAYHRETKELEELPVPPHSVLAETLGDRHAFFVHHNGAVVRVDLEAKQFAAMRAGEDGEIEEEWDAFEQRRDVHGAALVRGARPVLYVLDENENLQPYRITEDGFEVGEATDLSAQRLAGGEEVLVHATPDAAFLQRGEVTTRLEVQEPRTIAVRGTDVFVLDGRVLRRFSGDQVEEVRRFGDRVVSLSVSSDGSQAAAVGADGRIRVHALDGGGEAVLALRPQGDERELVISS
ncbi:MAG: hypothetical protein AAGE52_28290 [Myxococcota bacterium]